MTDKTSNRRMTLNTKLVKTLKNYKELIGFIAALITFVTVIGNLLINKFVGNLAEPSINRDKYLLIGIIFLNILVLVVAVFSIKAIPLLIEENEFKKLNKHLLYNNEKDSEHVLSRVNELVRQLVYCIHWFVIILLLFYLIQFLMEVRFFWDGSQIPYKEFEPIIKVKSSIIGIFSNESANLSEAVQYSIAQYLAFEIFTNFTNLFSAAYLFLAFQVLFLVTLEKDDKTWRLEGFIPMSIAVSITILNIVCFFLGIFGASLLIITHLIRLMGGVYNGVAMSLLFSRFISMEYFFQNSSEGWQRKFYFYGTIIILPLYVVVQPLYGFFNASEIGSAELFKAIVFLVCFWGKLFFLLFIYTMLTKKWIHSYLFMVLSQQDTLSNISKDLKDVDDL